MKRLPQLLAAALFLLVLRAASAPAVMLLTDHAGDWGLPRRVTADTGTVFGIVPFSKLSRDELAKYNAVVVFDLSRIDDNATSVNCVNLNSAAHQRIGDLLEAYVRDGGGLYVYGCSFTHMGQGLAVESLNRFLRRLDAQVLFEELHDPPNEVRQPDGRQVLYARANTIVEHPATQGVTHLWVAIGHFSYGPWLRPLQLGPDWTPLIRTSEQFTSAPLGNPQEAAQPVEGATTAVKGKSAVIYAARTLGKGRVILNGGESTISFFNYDYSPYADREWGRIPNERGLDGVPSDGNRLFEASLAWLTAPSLESGVFGGYQPPPPKPFEPPAAVPISWPEPGPIRGKLPYQKGVIGAMTAGCGGSGTVADYAAKAADMGLGYIVFAGQYNRMNEAAWKRLVADCEAASTATFAAIPALVTRDHVDNWFLQAGPQSWPQPVRLDPDQPGRVRDHLGYWMSDCNFPMRAAFDFRRGSYPPWLHSGYDSFALHTWRDGKLVDEAMQGLLYAQMQGDRPRVISVSLLTGPDRLAGVHEFTYLYGSSPEAVAKALRGPQFSGGAISYVSSGPTVRQWHVTNARRNSVGLDYVPGTQRWRALLAVDSTVPLKQVTFYDGLAPWRVYRLDGTSAELTVDGLHDGRHVLSAVVEDQQGGRAVLGAQLIQDNAFVQYFCSDRCNIMAGMQTTREPDGHLVSMPATSQLYKAGRLGTATVGKGESLPGIDGSGGGVQFFLSSDLRLVTGDPVTDEQRSQVHQILRPYESADTIVFDTPIVYRSPDPEHTIYGHAPYVQLVEPREDARLTQYHFYREPAYPSAALAEFTLTARHDLTTKPGWNGLSARYANTWGRLTHYEVIRADNTSESGPAADEKTGTRWVGTLQAGDSVYFSELGEGFYVARGPVAAVIECIPSRHWFRVYLGRTDAFPLKAGESVSVRLVPARMPGAGSAGRTQWLAFRDQFGFAGKTAYTVDVKGGAVVDQHYLLELEVTASPGLTATFGGSLPQRLPIRIDGLSGHETVAMVDLDRHEWKPLGTWNGAAFTQLKLTGPPRHVYIGSLLTCDQPDLRLTLLPANADGSLEADIHNPTANELAATVRVPVATFLADLQEQPVTVPPMASVRIKLTAKTGETIQ